MILKLWIPKTFVGWWYLLFRWKNFLLYKEEVQRDLKRTLSAYVSVSARNDDLYAEVRNLKEQVEHLRYEIQKYKTKAL